MIEKIEQNIGMIRFFMYFTLCFGFINLSISLITYMC